MLTGTKSQHRRNPLWLWSDLTTLHLKSSAGSGRLTISPRETTRLATSIRGQAFTWRKRRKVEGRFLVSSRAAPSGGWGGPGVVLRPVAQAKGLGEVGGAVGVVRDPPGPAAPSAAPWVDGPFGTGLMSTLGLGGLLAGRLPMHRPGARTALTGAMTLASVALSLTRNLVIVAVAQVVLVLIAVVLGIHVARRLHDAVPSTVRAGVASGTSAFAWIAFLPFALVFGVVSRDRGVDTAAWMITGAVLLVGLALAVDAGVRRRDLGDQLGQVQPATSGRSAPCSRV